MTMASRNGASGSGCVAVGPPAMTSGSSSPRSAARSGMPPRSSIVRMFVYVSSNWSEKPTTSKSRSGRALSSDTSGRPRARSSRLHVDPRRVAALGERARVVVQDLVEDLEAEVAHPDVVDVGEGEADARLDRRPVLRRPSRPRRRRSAPASPRCRGRRRTGGRQKRASSRWSWQRTPLSTVLSIAQGKGIVGEPGYR